MARESSAKRHRAKAPAPDDLAKRDLSRREDGSRRRVLYAEDQSSTRIVTTALLKRMGFEVEAVEDGELALERAKASAFDIILLDIEMPNMDGVTAARHIKADIGPCQQTPIMAMSAFLADSTEHSVWRDAFDCALPKPANSNELRRALGLAIDKKPARARLPASPDASVEKSESLWGSLAKTMPAGTRTVLIKTATQEMHHQILALAACGQTTDLETIKTARHVLKGLALSFDVPELLQIMARSNPPLPDVLALLNAVVEWNRLQLR